MHRHTGLTVRHKIEKIEFLREWLHLRNMSDLLRYMKPKAWASAISISKAEETVSLGNQSHSCGSSSSKSRPEEHEILARMERKRAM